MMIEELLKFGPLIAGALLIIAGILLIWRKREISGKDLALFALGAIMFAIPILSNFTFKTPGGVEFSGQIGVQIGVQGAELKREISDIKIALEALAKQSGGQAAATVSAAMSPTKKPAAVVLIIYVSDKKDLALKFEGFLLASGYAANSIFSDFSELGEAGREKEGTIRFLYTERTEAIAGKIQSELKAKFPQSTRIVNSPRKSLASSDMQIQLF